MKKYLLIIFILPLLLISFSPFTSSSSLIEICHADDLGATAGGGGSAQLDYSDPQAVDARAPFFPGQDKYDNIGDYISGFYTFSIWVVTIVSVIMIIWGGYMIITSSGNPEAVKKGREIVFSSLVSLGLLVLATVILGIISPQLVKNPWVDLGLPSYGQTGDSIPSNPNNPSGNEDNGTTGSDGSESITEEDNYGGTNENFFPAPTPIQGTPAPPGPIQA